MAIYHGYGGKVSWTADGSEPNAPIFTTFAVESWTMETDRKMHDVTPLAWNSQEFAPGAYKWRAELMTLMHVNVNPGFHNKLIATVTLTTSTGSADSFAGSCWIERIRALIRVDDAARASFIVRGTGNLTRTFA